MIKNFCEFGLGIIVASVLVRPFKNSVKTVDQRSPPVKMYFQVFWLNDVATLNANRVPITPFLAHRSKV